MPICTGSMEQGRRSLCRWTQVVVSPGLTSWFSNELRQESSCAQKDLQKDQRKGGRWVSKFCTTIRCKSTKFLEDFWRSHDIRATSQTVGCKAVYEQTLRNYINLKFQECNRDSARYMSIWLWNDPPMVTFWVCYPVGDTLEGIITSPICVYDW